VTDCDDGEIRDELRDFRQATTASVKPLRQDFVDLRTAFDQGFTEMRGKFDAAAAGQQRIVDLIQTVIEDRGSRARRIEAPQLWLAKYF
jgi:hypothetical protein